jgi:hypothetical protein
VFIFQLMKNKLLLGLAIASLLLAIVIGIFWVRSYWFYDAIFYSNLQRTHQLFSVPGAVVLSTWNHLPADDFVYDSTGDFIGKQPMRLYRNWEVIVSPKWDNPPGMHGGFWYNRMSHTVAYNGGSFVQEALNVAVPFWVPVLVFLLAPVAWGLKLWQRYHRARSGHCPFCNTEMPTPDRCPGCEREFETWMI